jgi:transmembrane sensor
MSKRPNFEARRHARRITEQAAAWYLEQQHEPSERQRTAFLLWLRASPSHVAEYLAIAQMHGDMKAAASIETLSMAELANRVKSESPVVAFPRSEQAPRELPAAQEVRRHRAVFRFAAAAAAIVLMVAGGMHWRNARSAFNQRYAADATAVRDVELPDGSLVQLAQNSVIDVQFDNHLRHISVVSGNALFDVGKDPHRPMLVSVGGHVLQDIGTVFDVRHDAEGDTLTVISGRVRVWNTPKAWLARMQDFAGEPPVGNHAVADLTAGQEIDFHVASASAVHPAVIAKTTAWLPTEIRFQHETVSDVARRFNAYTSTPLVIEDARVAGLHISGVFHADNPEAFIAYLSSLPGVQVVRGDDRVRVLAASDAGHAGSRKL